MGRTLRVLAEGDSWFKLGLWNLSLGFTIEQELLGAHLIADPPGVTNLAFPGSLLADMVRFQLDDTLIRLVKEHSDVLLFSGGGNDLVDKAHDNDPCALDRMIIPRAQLDPAAQDPMDPAAARSFLFGVLKPYYETLLARVRRKRPDIHVVLHGYAYAYPDNTPFHDPILKDLKLGPWFGPAYEAKGYGTDGPDLELRKAGVRSLIDMFHEMQLGVAAGDPLVHVLDLRALVEQDTQDWRDEFHLSKSGRDKVAPLFVQTLKAILDSL